MATLKAQVAALTDELAALKAKHDDVTAQYNSMRRECYNVNEELIKALDDLEQLRFMHNALLFSMDKPAQPKPVDPVWAARVAARRAAMDAARDLAMRTHSTVLA